MLFRSLSSNILIISDRAGNVNRMVRIIRRIDQVANQDPEIVPLQNASASEIVRVVNSFYQGAAATEGVAVKVVADERSNSVLIGGDQAQRLRIRALIAHLDTPLEADGEHPGRYLHYSRSEERRVGEEGRTPWLPHHLKKKKILNVAGQL